jgi:hypothetical protein
MVAGVGARYRNLAPRTRRLYPVDRLTPLFIPDALYIRPRPARSGDPRDAAKPTFVGQRGQIHVGGGCTIAAYSWPGRSPRACRLVWLRDGARPTSPHF